MQHLCAGVPLRALAAMSSQWVTAACEACRGALQLLRQRIQVPACSQQVDRSVHTGHDAPS